MMKMNITHMMAVKLVMQSLGSSGNWTQRHGKLNVSSLRALTPLEKCHHLGLNFVFVSWPHGPVGDATYRSKVFKANRKLKEHSFAGETLGSGPSASTSAKPFATLDATLGAKQAPWAPDTVQETAHVGPPAFSAAVLVQRLSS
eukprot:3786700-Amphidinium_carterae.1